MKCCETCQHWESPDDVDRRHYDGRGTCNRIVHEDTGPKDAEAAVMDFEGYQAWLRTKASFGCALWEPRDD